MTAIDLNPAISLDLKARVREPWSLLITVTGVDWSGPAECVVRAGGAVTDTLICTPTVVVSRTGDDTTFALALTKLAAATVPSGYYNIDVRSATGEVRAAGHIGVRDSVTA